MRFNKQELVTLATQPSNKFEKEGPLFVTERQEGFFRKTEGRHTEQQQKQQQSQQPQQQQQQQQQQRQQHVGRMLLMRQKSLSCISGGTAKVSSERWCRLRGNLLFYFKSNDPFSEPQGCLVLEKYQCLKVDEGADPQSAGPDGYAFYLEFQDGMRQRFTANSEQERLEWMQAIGLAGYDMKRAQLKYLREEIDRKRGMIHDVDIDMLRLQTGKEIDLNEVPICESVISCDNLLCDGNGKPPNPSVVVQVTSSSRSVSGWIKYGRTEVIERSSNPQFICTIQFRACDGLSADSQIRFTAYDVREKVTQTAVPIGWAEVALGVIADTTRLRIPLRTQVCGESAGFLTIATCAPDTERRTSNPRSPVKAGSGVGGGVGGAGGLLPAGSTGEVYGHRRSQSLPPKLGIKLFIPPPSKIGLVFTNPSLHTYRLHSGLGGDISVLEIMLESQLCYLLPQQLLSIWIAREKELLQEISGMGELGGEWRNRQMELLDKHLKLLKDYSQAKQYLQQQQQRGKAFKPSCRKADETVEFAPVNLHLQRMWAHNDTLKRAGILDVITVGAFTRHTGRSKTGGLIKLLQQVKDPPLVGGAGAADASEAAGSSHKVNAANDAVQAIKQLRSEIVAIMSQLLLLARSKNPKGMLPLCGEMMAKTRTLLNIWEPGLAEEAFSFIERHRIVDDTTMVTGGESTATEGLPVDGLSVFPSVPMSPFRKITQQLGALDLKSPELEDFATPLGPAPDLWPQTKVAASAGGSMAKGKSPSAHDISSTIATIQDTFNQLSLYQQQRDDTHSTLYSLPTACYLPTDEPSTSKAVTERPARPVPAPVEPAAAGLRFNETHFDVNGAVTLHSNPSPEQQQQQQQQSKKAPYSGIYDESGYCTENTAIVLGHNGAFLDTRVMSSSPSANYYRPTEEPEPLDLTQLNIEASVMCLVSKVKFLCGRCGSPAVRLRYPKGGGPMVHREGPGAGGGELIPPPDVVTAQPALSHPAASREQPVAVPSTATEPAAAGTGKPSLSSKDLNLALTQAIGEVTRKVKKGNKFTDGLDLSATTDWALELRPSMKKLRQAMDGLLKTARLMHSVQRLQQDMRKTSALLCIMYRRDVCFSQALTALVAGLMAKLWGQNVTENFISLLVQLGPLACFEGLLSLYGNETDMWGDMSVAVEDLATVTFALVRSNLHRDTKAIPVPRVTGSRQALRVLLPVPESVYCHLPPKEMVTFRVTPVFFNIGINEKATVAETLGYTREQHRSNWDNYDRLKRYHAQYRRVPFNFVNPACSASQDTPTKVAYTAQQKELLVPEATVVKFLDELEAELRAHTSKSYRVLHRAEDITRALQGLRFTSCKSAKDRTSMAVTLEQCRVLQQEFHLSASAAQNVLDTMRSEGTRSDNTMKNVGIRKYAFNLPQVLSLPSVYRPPAGAYGKAQS
ncbi:inositol polyphosphate-4-phosphatase type I A-like isoform X1 [Anopheles albimanus]|nr:inositol polyphosphate-4-phosphatase type I A-like isoform X1 [Anopheles albimanus]